MSRASLLLLIFMVNAASLTFEVVAARKAATYLGATAYAASLLLAAFLAGIGAGGWMAGRPLPSGNRRARVASGLLVGAGVLSTVAAPVLTWLGSVGPEALALQALLLTLVVAPVGAAVGFAYPVLTGMLAQRQAVGRSVALSYAADTIGAACGALTAGFLLIPRFGLATSGAIAGVVLLLAGVWLLVVRPAQPPPATKSAGTIDRSVPAVPPRRLLAIFFLTGFAALTLEVAWIRLFTLVVGTSMFSFSVTVAAFLAALGLGSQIMRARADRVTDPVRTLAFMLMLTAASSPVLLLVVPVWERAFLATYAAASNASLLFAAVFGLGLISILLPAGLMGAGFSLAARLASAGTKDPTAAIGRLYGINTLGGVFGAAVCGLVFLPAVGLKATILLAAVLYLLAGAALRPARAYLPSTACSLALLGLSQVREPAFHLAPYYHGLRMSSYEDFTATRDRMKILSARFSPYGVVTVSEDADYRYLRHNGRAEASTSPIDMSTQLLIAHIPMFMHPAPSRVINIGLGAGFTLGAIARHTEARAIVQAELDPRIVEAARVHFGALTGRPLDDSRVTTFVTDGRRMLARDTTLYDVIISEPSHLWVSGVSGLFTTEFYRIVASRLAPSGIFATWVPRYEMGADDLQIVAATLLAQFPHVTAFENGPADIILLASSTPFEPRLERVRAALQSPGISEDFGLAMQGFPLSAENLFSLLSQVAANAPAMAGAITADTPLNTDDWPVLEFHTAWAAVTRRTPVTANAL